MPLLYNRKQERKKIEPLAPKAKVLKQTGIRISVPRDKARTARLPGKRISKTGKIYWESRKSRSDMPGSNL